MRVRTFVIGIKGLVLKMNENKFDGLGETYAKFRPAYAPGFLDYLFSDFGLDKNSVIADVGAGTGILTKQLLDRGCKVIAVEPNSDMRAEAEKNLKEFAGFVSVNGTSESTGLNDCVVDCVTAAQAFHWFDAVRFKMECQRILKPGGMVVLVWNSRDVASQIMRDNAAVYVKFCPNFKGFAGGTHNNDAGFEDFFHAGYEKKTFQNDLVFDEEGFVGRSLSASYSLQEGDEGFDEYIAELKNFFQKCAVNGRMVMPNLTYSFAGKV